MPVSPIRSNAPDEYPADSRTVLLPPRDLPHPHTVLDIATRGRFAVEYQPLIDVRTESVVGYEALARFSCEDRSPIPPELMFEAPHANPLSAIRLDAQSILTIILICIQSGLTQSIEDKSMYVCLCHGVTDSDIRRRVRDKGACTMRELSRELGVATQCGKCGRCARQLLAEALTENDAELACAHAAIA